MANLVPVLQKGEELRNPAAWKNVQTVVSLGVSLAALAGAAGFPLPVDVNGVTAISTAVAGIANAFVVVASSKKVGFGDQ
jgi:hypothetical protein